MLVLATDLDGTFLSGSLRDRNRLYQLLRRLGDDLILVFVTGRALDDVKALLADPAIPVPDYVIADVGATVVRGGTLEPLEPLDSEIAARWVGEAAVMRAVTAAIDPDRCERQPQSQARRCSFFTDDPAAVQAVRTAVAPLDCDVVFSSNRFLDVLPGGTNKGSTLNRLIRELDVDFDDVLVCGDTLNDLTMFTGVPCRGAVIAGAEPLLYEATKYLPGIHRTTRSGAGGILEALNDLGFISNDPVEACGEAELVVVHHRLSLDAFDRGDDFKLGDGSAPGLALLGGRRNDWSVWRNETESGPLDSTIRTREDFKKVTLSSLQIESREAEQSYRAFARDALFPVLHGQVERARFDHLDFQHFSVMNRRFAERAAAEVALGGLVWIHDYNLWMVPEFLHELRPDVRIAFFHHTPFPASDVFNVSPFARELLSSLLSCDFVAFQIPRYCDNFVDAARSQLPLRIKARRACDPRFVSTGSALSVPDMVSELEYSGRSIALGAHPVGIDVRQIRQCMESPEWGAEAEQIRRELRCGKIVVSAECLDPINGTLQKLLAFERFLTLYPAWRGRVSFVDLCTASARSSASGLLAEVESAAERINQRFRVASLPSWKPATLVTRRLPWSTHLAYLAAADVLWVTPFRDGLNLSAKEYVSVRKGRGETGAVVLSEFAGASVELEGALLTNPYDIAEMVSTLQQALVMGADEQASRMRRLNEVVETFDLEHWARDFLRAAQKPLNAASLRLRRAAYGRVASR